MIEVKYEREGVVNVDTTDATLLEVSKLHGIQHFHACGGHARCSTCRVRVVEGAENLTPRTAAECALVERKGLGDEIRLACQARVRGPVTVRRLVLDDQDAEAAYVGTSPSGRGAGTAMEVAVLFSDIRGFTRFSERSYPYDVMHILNRYLQGMGEAIHRHDGYIDKYMGDGVMALFGMDGCGPQMAANQAVAASFDMITALKRFNCYMQDQFSETFQIGIGVHVGEVVVGEVGHHKRRQLTALGDVVNTASRVESATKEFSAELLVTEAVYGHVQGAVQAGRTVEATLKGKARPACLVELLAPAAGGEAIDDAHEHLYRAILHSITRMDAPGLLRLAFHDAICGGANGSIRLPDELNRPSNRGLDRSLARLQPIKDRFAEASWGDLIALAGAAAVERCGGPHIPLTLGRPEAPDCSQDGQVPDEHDPIPTLKDRFAARGLSARDMVALSGAHTLGKADGTPFTADPFSFTNSYFRHLIAGNDGMISSDEALLSDPQTHKIVEEYSRDEKAFFADFVSAYRKMCAF